MEIAIKLQTDEKALIQACIREERWAQKELYETYYSSMMGVCLRYANSSDEARDILHEGFLKVFRNIARYQIGTSLNGWVRQIMVNTAIDIYRKNVYRRTEQIENAAAIEATDTDIVGHFTAQDIMNAVQQLTPTYRTVFNLYALEGYSHKEIAEALNITESTSRSNLMKARTRLQEMLTSKIAAYDSQ